MARLAITSDLVAVINLYLNDKMLLPCSSDVYSGRSSTPACNCYENVHN